MSEKPTPHDEILRQLESAAQSLKYTLQDIIRWWVAPGPTPAFPKTLEETYSLLKSHAPDQFERYHDVISQTQSVLDAEGKALNEFSTEQIIGLTEELNKNSKTLDRNLERNMS